MYVRMSIHTSVPQKRPPAETYVSASFVASRDSSTPSSPSPLESEKIKRLGVLLWSQIHIKKTRKKEKEKKPNIKSNRGSFGRWGNKRRDIRTRRHVSCRVSGSLRTPGARTGGRDQGFFPSPLPPGLSFLDFARTRWWWNLEVF